MVAVERWAFLTRRSAPAEIEGLANPQLEVSSNRGGELAGDRRGPPGTEAARPPRRGPRRRAEYIPPNLCRPDGSLCFQ